MKFGDFKVVVGGERATRKSESILNLRINLLLNQKYQLRRFLPPEHNTSRVVGTEHYRALELRVTNVLTHFYNYYLYTHGSMNMIIAMNSVAVYLIIIMINVKLLITIDINK